MSYIKQFLKVEKSKSTQVVDEEISQEALPGIDKIAKKIAFKVAYRIFKKLFGNVIREGLADVFAFKSYSSVKAKATLFKVNRVKTSKLIPGYKPGLIPGKGFTDTFIFNDKQVTEEADIEKALLVCLKDTKRLFELSSTIADKAEALTLTENEEENGQIMEVFIGKHFPADLFSQFISTKGYTTLEKVQGCTDPDKHILEIEKTIRSTLARTDKVISELAEDEEVDANARKMLSTLLRATLDKHFAFLDNIVEWLYRSIGRQKKEVEEEETSTEGINTDTYSARKLTPKDWKTYFEWFARENGVVIPKDVYQHFTTVEDPVLYILDESGKLVTPYDVSAAITVTKSTNKLTFPTAIPDIFAAESQYADASYQAKHLRNKHPSQVKSVLGSTKWMPLVVSNNSEYHIVIDMDPAKGGKYGQVISVILHDGETDIQLIANSFTEYLNMIQSVSNEGIIDWVKEKVGLTKTTNILGLKITAPSNFTVGGTVKINQKGNAGRFLPFNKEYPDPILNLKRFIKGATDSSFIKKYTDLVNVEISHLAKAKATLQTLINKEYEDAQETDYVDWNEYPETVAFIKQTISGMRERAKALKSLLDSNPIIDFELYHHSGMYLNHENKLVGTEEVSFKLASAETYHDCIAYQKEHKATLEDVYRKVNTDVFTKLYDILNVTPTKDKGAEGEDYFASLWLDNDSFFELVTLFSDAMYLAANIDETKTFKEYLKAIKLSTASTESLSFSLEADDEDVKPESEDTDDTTEDTDTESEDKADESDDTEEPQENDEETESDTDADTENASEEDGTSEEGTEEESETTDDVEESEEEERKEVELDNPDENKVAIRDYLASLVGEQIDQLKLFSADEVNRPLYHISMNNKIKMFTPQVSNRTLGKENRSVPRISTSTSLIGCLNGYQSIMSDINGRSPNGFNGLHTVYQLPYQYAIKPSKQILPDVDNSDEYWLISWKKETYATTPSVAAEMFVPKVETVYGNDGRAQLVHLYMHVKEHELYIDHQIKLQPGYYYIKLNNYNYNYPLKNNEESIEVERITENEYNKVTALSIMIKQR